MQDDSFAPAAALLGDPVRARMLAALMDGRARTATELATAGAVAASTASAHLARLTDAGLLTVVRQGRHRYHRIAGEHVASAIEALLQLSAPPTAAPRSFGPRDQALRRARVCYDHLAGRLGVELADGMARHGFLVGAADRLALSPAGADWVRALGADPDALASGRRPACRFCLDWSERRSHLAGALGAALLSTLLERGMLARTRHSRALQVRESALRLLETLR